MKSDWPLGPGKPFKNVGASPPHLLVGFPGLLGPAKPQKHTPANLARLPSGTQLELHSASPRKTSTEETAPEFYRTPGNACNVRCWFLYSQPASSTQHPNLAFVFAAWRAQPAAPNITSRWARTSIANDKMRDHEFAKQTAHTETASHILPKPCKS